MSEQNVEVVRRVYAEWEQGKFGGAVALFDPDLVFESFMPDSSERVIFHGPEGVEVFMREFLAQWKDYRLVGEEFREVGKEKVLVAGHQSAIGRQSGVAVEMPMFSIWTLRDGKVVSLIVEFDRRRPSKPLGCGSRRCRRRTLNSAPSCELARSGGCCGGLAPVAPQGRARRGAAGSGPTAAPAPQL